jgi:hypothetical protein
MPVVIWNKDSLFNGMMEYDIVLANS